MSKPFLRGGIPELLRQARRIQEKLDNLKEELKNREETVISAGGRVSVTVTGDRKIKAIRVDQEMLKNEDLAMVEDLLVSSVNSALDKIDELIKTETEKITGGVDLPGFF